jgi:HipA-like C-terminal domain
VSTIPATTPVVDVSAWQAVEPESAGGDEKVWLGGADGARWLFKPRTEHEGWCQGEDWAEKVTTDLAGTLQVPVAAVELAVRDGRRGTISRDVAPGGWELQHGSLLLSELEANYVVREKTRRHHDLETIRRVLESTDPPAELPDLTSFEVLTGYLVLDALVANQDRHEENWAVLRPTPGPGPLRLAPSYDHGSSLGFNLMDRKRQLEIDRDGVPVWAARSRAQRFDQSTDGRLSLVDLAHRALGLGSATARHGWLSAVEALTEGHVATILGRIPGLSVAVRTFTHRLLLINRERLLR